MLHYIIIDINRNVDVFPLLEILTIIYNQKGIDVTPRNIRMCFYVFPRKSFSHFLTILKKIMISQTFVCIYQLWLILPLLCRFKLLVEKFWHWSFKHVNQEQSKWQGYYYSEEYAQFYGAMNTMRGGGVVTMRKDGLPYEEMGYVAPPTRYSFIHFCEISVQTSNLFDTLVLS